MKKEIIKNRKGENIIVVIEEAEDSKGLTFVMHALGGFKEQPHILSIAKPFADNNFTVVRFDTTNSTGQSGGKLENATISNYFQDLEDVIKWSQSQNWYQEPFWLSGHSLGGFSVAFFTINYPEKVKAVAPISCFISGELFIQTKEMKKVLELWEKTGLREWESSTQPGLIKRLKYGFIEDCLKYDLLKKAHQINCPILLVVGNRDETTPLEHQKIFFDSLVTEKEIHIIKDLKHTPREKNHLEELESIIGKWIQKNK